MGRPRGIPRLHFHTASGQFRLNIPGGKPLYFGADKAAADKAYKRWLAEQILADDDGQEPVLRPSTRALTIAEALTVYLEHAVRRYPGKKQTARIDTGIEVVCELYGSEPVAAFTAPRLKAVRKALLKRDAKDSPGTKLSRNYANSVIGCLQTGWGWLESEGLAPPGSAAHLRSVVSLREGEGGQETPPVVPVEDSIVEATLPHLSPIVAAMVQVQRLTGMRPGELCRLRRADLSLSVDEVLEPLPRLRVRAQMVGNVLIWLYAPAAHKTRHKGKSRLVAIGPRAQAVLQPFLEGRKPEEAIFQPREAVAHFRAVQRQARKTKVQPSQADRSKEKPRKVPGSRYTTDSYRQAIQRACERAGLEVWAPNQLRHTAGSQANDQGDWDTAQAMLGHSHPDQTATYALQAFGKAAKHVATSG